MQKYYQDELKFNGAYSRNNLYKTEDGTCINFDEYESIETHWKALHVNDNNETYFDSFRVEYIPKEIRKFIVNKNVKIIIFRIQTYDSIMCGYFYIGFICLFFSPNDYKKNDKLVFSITKKMKKLY